MYIIKKTHAFQNHIYSTTFYLKDKHTRYHIKKEDNIISKKVNELRITCTDTTMDTNTKCIIYAFIQYNMYIL